MKIDRDHFVAALDQAGLDDDALRDSYSGRAMFGSTCVGLVCDIGQFALFCASVGSFMDDWEWVGRVHSDQMGLSTVWYWPGIQLTEKGEQA
jgi:hypothetical protein